MTDSDGGGRRAAGRHFAAEMVGMWLFLAALAVGFASSLAGFAIIRTTGDRAPAMRTLRFPPVLALSTTLLLASGAAMEWSLRAVRSERQREFRVAFLVATLLGVGFLIAQTPGMFAILEQHLVLSERDQPIYVFVFVLIVLHGLHVIGGLGPMAVVSIRAFQGRYDHEFHRPVLFIAMYWHFLDAVWLTMLALFLLLS